MINDRIITFTLIASLIIIIVLVVGFIIVDDIKTNKMVVSTTEFQRPKEKRYMYVILGKRTSLFNTIEFRYIESDTKLTYRQLKNKNPNLEIMSINVLDRKTGKF